MNTTCSSVNNLRNRHTASRTKRSGFQKTALSASLILAELLCASLWACDDDASGSDKTTEKNSEDIAGTDTESDVSTDSNDTAGDVTPDFECSPKDPKLATMDADELFSASTLPTFDLYLPPNEWEELKVNARDETYIKAQACFEGQSLGEIGLRFKGGYGTLLFCFDEDDNLICPKLSIKLKFSEYDEENRFFGLKRLNFQGYTQDESYMREKLAYDLYREMGIVAPRAAWAKIRVNDEPQGLFGMVEQVDGRFTADRFPENPDGNLYKEVWPTFSNDELLARKLKTNKEESDLSGFKAFAKAVSEAKNEALRQIVGEYMNLDYLARYMAVDDAIFNIDGVTALYEISDFDLFGNHNFYIYEASTDHYVLIPWDEDATFGMRQGFGGVPRWMESEDDDCDGRYPSWSGVHRVMHPGCDAVFKAIAQEPEAHRAAIAELLAGPFTETALNDRIDKYEALIRDEVAADPNGQGIGAFELSLSYLKARIPRLISRLEKLGAGESWTRLNIDFNEMHDFEGLDDLSLWTGMQLEMAANVGCEVSLTREDPLSGDQSLKLEFDFGNNLDQWGQWMLMQMPPKGGYQDISSLTGIRFLMRADSSRSVRVDVTSPYESDLMGGVAFGWDVVADTETKVFERLFEDAAVPTWAVDPGDDLEDTLSYTSGIRISPQCYGRDGNGFLPDDTRDAGYIEIDDIEFF